MEPDVLVGGAGPAGAAVSILLARQGYRVLLEAIRKYLLAQQSIY